FVHLPRRDAVAEHRDHTAFERGRRRREDALGVHRPQRHTFGHLRFVADEELRGLGAIAGGGRHEIPCLPMGRKRGIVHSSVACSNTASTTIPSRIPSLAMPTMLLYSRGPSSNSTRATLYGSASLKPW